MEIEKEKKENKKRKRFMAKEHGLSGFISIG
jgi:hypothetical protein